MFAIRLRETSTKMGSLTIFIWCLIIVQCHATCEVKESVNAECSSAADINASGEKTEWTRLTINNNNKLEPILPNAFMNVPNLSELVFIGSVNEFKYKAFKNLNKLIKLQLFNCDIPEIKSGMLTNLPIHEFLIYTSKVTSLAVRSFDNLPNLKNVYIHKNTISNIPAGVFSYTNIENLYLNDNGIQTIENEAFFGMEKLFTLALERNHLTSFTPSLFIGESSQLLSILWLARNNITRITTDSFIHFPNLRVLLYHFNPLRIIEDKSFNGLPDLRYMDLSNTNLDYISPNAFAPGGLARLDVLFLQNCRFTSLSSDFLAKVYALRSITIGGNPWQCVCYQKLRKLLEVKKINILCDEEYFEGSRPVCITPTTNAEICEYDASKTKDLYDQFTVATQDYVKLAPLCKIFCDNNKSCYSHDFDVLLFA